MEDTTNKPQLAFMPWYSASFYGATRTWPLIARAVYRELLDAQWDAGGLPDDSEALRMIAGATPAEWRKAWPFVAPKFQAGEDGLLRNARLEQHRERALELHRRRQKGAAKTNAKRWGVVVPLHSEGDSA